MCTKYRYEPVRRDEQGRIEGRANGTVSPIAVFIEPDGFSPHAVFIEPAGLSPHAVFIGPAGLCHPMPCS